MTFRNTRYECHQILLDGIKQRLPELKELLEKIQGHWTYEDMMYRMYHHSFKVQWVQEKTKAIVKILREIGEPVIEHKMSDPDTEKLVKFAMKRHEVTREEYLWGDYMFKKMYDEGTDKPFKMEYNQDFAKWARPCIEVFLHAKFFLEMAVKYGEELEEAPSMLPSGWAALLYFYNIR